MKEIELQNNRGIMLVDDEDFETYSKYGWYFQHGYARTDIYNGGNRIRIYAHHLINGKIPNLDVDHINGNKLDNRKSNLRFVTRSTNMGNNTKTGVRFLAGKWEAKIRHNYKVIYLGRFNSEEEALNAKKDKARELGYILNY